MKTIYPVKESCLLLLLFLLVQTSCKNWVEVPVPQLTSSVAGVYTNDATAASILTGIYANMSNFNAVYFVASASGALTNMSLFSSLSADELTLHRPVSVDYNSFNEYYTNALVLFDPNSVSGARTNSVDYWTMLYPIVFTCNSAIEGLETSTGLTPAVKQQLMGEAKFMRAFCYFYLVNLYGPVPLAISTDWKVNSTMVRTPVAQVNQQIIADLKEAESLLSKKYLKGDAMTEDFQRVRPTKWAAAALLAREYLFTKDWAGAEAQASVLINNPALFYLSEPNSPYYPFGGRGNAEAIWQLQAVNAYPNNNTGEGVYFKLQSYGPLQNDVYLSTGLVNSFEPGDLRKKGWVDSVTVSFSGKTYYFPHKYRVGPIDVNYSQEYEVMLRLGEQFLIRAEARAQLNNVSGSQEDVNVIRTRAGLPNTTATNQTALLAAVMQERKVELFTEWGHRWLDLKRTGTVDAVMTAATALKGGTWNTNWQWYPIPSTEIRAAPQLTQNAGYTQ